MALLILILTGCSVETSYDRDYVSQGIQDRSDYSLGRDAPPGEFNLPEGVTLADGLTQDEAVAIALWNNAQFQADLAALGFARADLVEAHMFSNPVFSILFPIGPKPLEAALDVPINDLWQRHHHIAMANLDAQSLSENLIEHGLGLIRDVQTTYTDLWLAQEQLHLAQEDAQLRVQRADIAQGRFRAGDISEMALSVARVDSLKAADAVARFSKEVAIQRQQLRALLGLISEDTPLGIVPPHTTSSSPVSTDELLATALAARPDLRAAELSLEAAGERLGWERSRILNLMAIIDAKDEGEDFLTVGPGLSLEIPIFNRNDAGIARAEAEMEQAARRYEVVHQNIILQVKQAHTRYMSAWEKLELWGNSIVPALETAVDQARKSFAVGEQSYPSVLEAEQNLIEARMHRTESTADLWRSAAELNYCIGKKMI